jgi:hypothetical protein
MLYRQWFPGILPDPEKLQDWISGKNNPMSGKWTYMVYRLPSERILENALN